jgi:hypothetical protein
MKPTLDQQISEVRALLEKLLQRLATDSAPVAVTKARAARELEVDPKTIGRMVRDGQLGVVLVRSRPRIPFAELLRVAALPEREKRLTRVEKFNARAEAERARQLRRAR